MKYIAKFVNGYHVSFNTETYENTQVFYLRKDADLRVSVFNLLKNRSLKCPVWKP